MPRETLEVLFYVLDFWCGKQVDPGERPCGKHFDRTLSRGPDMSRLTEIPCGCLGFHRLAIMGLNESGMQPFERDGSYVVCNGELYGFRPLKKRLEEKYTFQERFRL